MIPDDGARSVSRHLQIMHQESISPEDLSALNKALAAKRVSDNRLRTLMYDLQVKHGLEEGDQVLEVTGRILRVHRRADVSEA